MMRHVFAACFAALTITAHCQKNIFDTVIPPDKTYYTYIGIQSNLLLQQFISFNSNSSINTNPYTFCYARNNLFTGSGFAFGTGFNISENSSDDGVSFIHVNNVNVSFRGGYEKKYLQRQRFVPFWGAEFGMGVIYRKVTSRLTQSFNTNEVVSETTTYFAGPSIRGGLQCAITKHILLGTEFFVNSQISTTRTVTSNNPGFFTSNFVPFNIGVQAPTALFLLFRY